MKLIMENWRKYKNLIESGMPELPGYPHPSRDEFWPHGLPVQDGILDRWLKAHSLGLIVVHDPLCLGSQKVNKYAKSDCYLEDVRGTFTGQRPDVITGSSVEDEIYQWAFEEGYGSTDQLREELRTAIKEEIPLVGNLRAEAFADFWTPQHRKCPVARRSVSDEDFPVLGYDPTNSSRTYAVQSGRAIDIYITLERGKVQPETRRQVGKKNRYPYAKIGRVRAGVDHALKLHTTDTDQFGRPKGSFTRIGAGHRIQGLTAAPQNDSDTPQDTEETQESP